MREFTKGDRRLMKNIATPRQQVILDFITAFTVSHCYGPSIRDIGVGLGITSPNGVRCHIMALRKKGLLRDNTSRIARGIVLVDSMTVSRKRLTEVLRLANEDGNLACAEVLNELLGIEKDTNVSPKIPGDRLLPDKTEESQ